MQITGTRHGCFNSESFLQQQISLNKLNEFNLLNF